MTKHGYMIYGRRGHGSRKMSRIDIRLKTGNFRTVYDNITPLLKEASL